MLPHILANLLESAEHDRRAHGRGLESQAARPVLGSGRHGRRVAENGGGGTDHGHGSALLVMSGHLAKGNVVTKWPGLAESALDRVWLKVTDEHEPKPLGLDAYRARFGVELVDPELVSGFFRVPP